MLHTHKIAKHIYLKRAGLQELLFPAGPLTVNDYDRSPSSTNSYRGADTDRAERSTTVWREPDHGLAVRTPALKQAKTARGHVFYGHTVIYHESELEHRVSVLLKTYRGVARLISQYPKVEYVDDDGVIRHHTFDYFVEWTDGTRIAIAVKYERKREEMLQLLERICAYGITGVDKNGDSTPGVADAVALVTDAQATYEAFENAFFLLSSRDHHDDAECAVLHNIVLKMPDTFRFGQLLLGCWPRAKRRTAIWRLIDLAVLQPVSHGRIDELTWLRRA